ncbi:MAG TPA: dihydroorotase [Negativicutes bacterium]|nr:dihydroorotase [Negativicutes bacterium]
MKLVIRGGWIIDPAQQINKKADILLAEGKIAAIGEGLSAAGAQIIDATGKYVVPGLIDMHVHLRDPGLEAKEDIYTGTRAAAMGGFTSVACMPNTRPVIDNISGIGYVQNRAQSAGAVNVYPIGAITKGSEGKELAEIGDMVQAGAVAVSDDGKPVSNAQVMRLAFEYAKMFDIPVIAHSEDPYLAEGGQMHEGYVSTVLGLKGIPAAAEEVMIARDCLLAEYTGGRLHVAHVSTAGAVEIIRRAKARGVKVTAEVTPHHLTLTDEAVRGFDTNTKVNPPLRGTADIAALIAGLKDGTIDSIATDHAPHAFEEKDVEYRYAPFGISGLETAVPLVLQALVHSGEMKLEEVVAAMTLQPARILGLDKGTLETGKDADVTILDPAFEHTLDPQRFVSKGKNSPYGGRQVKGRVVATIVAGEVVMQEGRLLK